MLKYGVLSASFLIVSSFHSTISASQVLVASAILAPEMPTG